MKLVCSLLITAVLIAGCGKTKTVTETVTVTSEPTTLSAEDELGVAEANLAISKYVLASLEGKPTGDQLVTDTIEGIDLLIKLVRESPCDVFGEEPDARTVRQVVEDTASSFEGVDDDQAGKLDRVLEGVEPCPA